MRTVSRGARRLFLRAGMMRRGWHAVPPRVQREATRETLAATRDVREIVRILLESPNADWWRECRLAVNIAICEVVCDTPRPFSVLTESGERAAIQPFIYL